MHGCQSQIEEHRIAAAILSATTTHCILRAHSDRHSFQEAITSGHGAPHGRRTIRRILLTFASFIAATRHFAIHPATAETRAFIRTAIHILAGIERHFCAIANRWKIARCRVLRQAREISGDLFCTFHGIRRDLLCAHRVAITATRKIAIHRFVLVTSIGAIERWIASG